MADTLNRWVTDPSEEGATGEKGGSPPRPPGTGGGMQLITRAAAILRALEGQSTGRSLGQIAKATGLPRPTVQRIVDALRIEQFVADDPVHGGVRLGSALARLAGSIRTDLTAFARPHLDRLARAVRETAALTVLQDGKAVLLATISPPDREIVLTSRLGAALPLHCTADGKALLAALPPDARRAMLGDALPRRTANTRTAAPVLLEELAEIARGGGVALDREETTEGICAVAASIVDAAGTRHAISLIVPSSRFHDRLPRLRAALVECRATIEAAAGLAPARGSGRRARGGGTAWVAGSSEAPER